MVAKSQLYVRINNREKLLLFPMELLVMPTGSSGFYIGRWDFMVIRYDEINLVAVRKRERTI